MSTALTDLEFAHELFSRCTSDNQRVDLIIALSGTNGREWWDKDTAPGWCQAMRPLLEQILDQDAQNLLSKTEKGARLLAVLTEATQQKRSVTPVSTNAVAIEPPPTPTTSEMPVAPSLLTKIKNKVRRVKNATKGSAAT